MKIKSPIFSSIYTFVLISSISATSIVFAKTIDMYEQPKADAKKVGTIDVSAGVMPIFKPKDSDWVKVADPRNGNVGWVKSTDLSNGSPTTFSFTQKIIDGNKDQQKYQVFEFGNSTQSTTGKTQDMIQQMDTQKIVNDKAIQQSIQKMVNDINSVYQQQLNLMKEGGYPVIMPIVIFPGQQTKMPAQVDTRPDNTKK